jgi:hypothetical protein
MTHVLGVATLQIGYPIELPVLMKSDYPAIQNLNLLSRTHEQYPTGA